MLPDMVCIDLSCLSLPR